MKEHTPLLTVIVPAYNVQQYLSACLDSLVHQALRVIVVNDGSADDTGSIARRYCRDYPETVQLVEQENWGLGAARNAGLALADTPYVTFLDSDDWQDCRFAERFEKALERWEETPDLILTLPGIWDDATRRVLPWKDEGLFLQLFYPRGGDISACLTAKEAPLLHALEASACRKIYRLAFLKEIAFAFPQGVRWEDVQPHFYAIHKAKSIVGLKETGFVYRVNTGSQITADGGAARLDMVPVFRAALEVAWAEAWPRSEQRQVAGVFCRFSQWSIGQANADVIGPLLKQLHGLARRIPLGLYAGHGKKSALVLALLASPFYGILKDYRTREWVKNLTARLRRDSGGTYDG